MNLFFTADTHFSHARIIKHSNRPFESIEEMDATITSRWNAVVRPNDLVYHLGDFAWKNHAEHRRKLNGQIILIRGNHDWNIPAYELRNLFREVHDVLYLRHEAKRLWLSHYAHRTWPNRLGQHRRTYHLFGHSHGRIGAFPDAASMDIGMDLHGFRPLAWEEVWDVFEAPNREVTV